MNHTPMEPLSGSLCRLPYEAPRMTAHALPTGQSLLVTFSLEGEFEDFEDGGEF